MGIRWGFAACGVACAIIVACSSFSGDAADGSSEDGGTDGTPGDAAARPDRMDVPPSAVCPDPSMVRWNAINARFCIDRLEVTEDEYLGFTLSQPGALAQLVTSRDFPEGCRGASAPSIIGSSAKSGSHLPVVKVGFCAAALYCVSMGKRMCGSIASKGGPVEAGIAHIDDHEWVAACTNNGLWPNSVAPAQDGGCWLGQSEASGPRDAGAAPTCGHDGLLDMVGNVWEWVNERDDTFMTDGSPGASYTRIVGAQWKSSPNATCREDFGVDGPAGKYANGTPDIGFRCCASLP
jgi:formylglycine-generating enzyme required for sulfatase activity